jgi:hypothetical protein
VLDPADVLPHHRVLPFPAVRFNHLTGDKQIDDGDMHAYTRKLLSPLRHEHLFKTSPLSCARRPLWRRGEVPQWKAQRRLPRATAKPHTQLRQKCLQARRICDGKVLCPSRTRELSRPPSSREHFSPALRPTTKAGAVPW